MQDFTDKEILGDGLSHKNLLQKNLIPLPENVSTTI